MDLVNASNLGVISIVTAESASLKLAGEITNFSGLQETSVVLSIS